MNFSFLVALFVIMCIVFSGILSALTLEVGVFSSVFLLGGLTNGPAFSSNGSLTSL